jgi:hypothetical protein
MTRVVPHQGTREVGIVVFNDVLLLDATGPADVFSRANHHLCHPDQPDRYRLTALSTFGDRTPVRLLRATADDPRVRADSGSNSHRLSPESELAAGTFKKRLVQCSLTREARKLFGTPSLLLKTPAAAQ